ncbi:hypothetical protein GOP47_0007878, partial [Adiantum capillus-veneris]
GNSTAIDTKKPQPNLQHTLVCSQACRLVHTNIRIESIYTTITLGDIHRHDNIRQDSERQNNMIQNDLSPHKQQACGRVKLIRLAKQVQSLLDAASDESLLM